MCDNWKYLINIHKRIIKMKLILTSLALQLTHITETHSSWCYYMDYGGGTFGDSGCDSQGRTYGLDK